MLELAARLGSFQRAHEFILRPRIVEGRGAQAKIIQCGLTGIDGHGRVPQANGIELTAPDALCAGQEVGDQILVDGERLHVACPCPARHDRAIHIDDARQITGKRGSLDRVVVAFLREALQHDIVVALR